MKVIIAGGRDILNYNFVLAGIAQSGFTIDEVVSGKAKGVDKLGEDWANANGKPITPFKAKWHNLGVAKVVKKHTGGRAYNALAGNQRNEKMAVYADALIAIWDGKSKGTKDMITRARNHGLHVFIYRTDKQNSWWEDD